MIRDEERRFERDDDEDDDELVEVDDVDEDELAEEKSAHEQAQVAADVAETEQKAAAKAQAARAEIEFADEGRIHRPTRAELVLAFLWAAALSPVIAAPVAGVMLLAIGEKQLVSLAVSISGHGGWPLMLLGTAFFFVLVAQLAPKTRERPLSAARVLVFERGRSFGPSMLLLVLLVELGGCGAVLSR